MVRQSVLLQCSPAQHKGIGSGLGVNPGAHSHFSDSVIVIGGPSGIGAESMHFVPYKKQPLSSFGHGSFGSQSSLPSQQASPTQHCSPSPRMHLQISGCLHPHNSAFSEYASFVPFRQSGTGGHLPGPHNTSKHPHLSTPNPFKTVRHDGSPFFGHRLSNSFENMISGHSFVHLIFVAHFPLNSSTRG